MQELHTKTGTFSKGWLVVAKITENTRKWKIGWTNCHLYHYAGNNPVTYFDPDGRISEISYSERDERVSIVIPVKYAEGTTYEQKKLFSEAAEKAWSGTFGKYHVKLTVKEQAMGELNIITFNSTDIKVSNVKNH